MISDRFEIVNYVAQAGSKITVSWGGQDVEAKGIIRCDGKEADILLYFVENPDQYIPIVNIEKKAAATFHHIDHMPIFLDLLRNEKPIFGYIDSRFPDATKIMTTIEPIGEGE